MPRKSRPVGAVLAAAVAGSSLAIGLSVSAGAQDVLGGTTTDPTGVTSCRASVLRVGDGEPFVANPDELPCVKDHAGAVDRLDLGPAQSRGVVSARTSDDPPETFVALSKARAADVRIKPEGSPTPILRVQGANTRAGVRCTQKGNPRLLSRSRVAAIRMGTSNMQMIRDPVEIDLSPLAFIYINRTIEEPQRITQRAVEVDLGADGTPDVVIAEAIANYEEGNPCPPPEPPAE